MEIFFHVRLWELLVTQSVFLEETPKHDFSRIGRIFIYDFTSQVLDISDNVILYCWRSENMYFRIWEEYYSQPSK